MGREAGGLCGHLAGRDEAHERRVLRVVVVRQLLSEERCHRVGERARVLQPRAERVHQVGARAVCFLFADRRAALGILRAFELREQLEQRVGRGLGLHFGGHVEGAPLARGQRLPVNAVGVGVLFAQVAVQARGE